MWMISQIVSLVVLNWGTLLRFCKQPNISSSNNWTFNSYYRKSSHVLFLVAIINKKKYVKQNQLVAHQNRCLWWCTTNNKIIITDQNTCIACNKSTLSSRIMLRAVLGSESSSVSEARFHVIFFLLLFCCYTKCLGYSDRILSFFFQKKPIFSSSGASFIAPWMKLFRNYFPDQNFDYKISLLLFI